jgi:ribonuclease BN (tRNA processing enzyme)
LPNASDCTRARGALDAAAAAAEIVGGRAAVIRGADILIHDAQYTPEDYTKKRGWGHSCYIDTVNYAIDAGVKALYLFHHDPAHDDGKVAEMHQHCLEIIRHRGAQLICTIAREGLVVEL